jgi:hypothetical protein
MEKNNWGASPVEEHRISESDIPGFGSLSSILIILKYQNRRKKGETDE